MEVGCATWLQHALKILKRTNERFRESFIYGRSREYKSSLAEKCFLHQCSYIQAKITT